MARINITSIRRRQLVDAAVVVMARQGWSDTSIDEVTKEAGVSRGLVSYHFKDKADLLSGVLSRCRETYSEAVANAIAATTDELERTRLMIRSAIAQIRDNPVNYQVFLHFAANSLSQPELGEQIRVLYSDYRRAMATGLAAGQRQGIFGAELDPDATATLMIGTIVGLALQWIIDPEGYPFEAAARQAEDMLMAYLTTGATAGKMRQPARSGIDV